jgi:DNA-binding transcriptional MerR regulator
MPAFTIGSLARTAGVSVETVRYYERRGLLERPVRRGSEYREYSDADVARLQFIRRAKELGFTLSEISELLPAADTGCVDGVLIAARAKLAQVDADIAAQYALRARLARLVDACADGRGDCVTLDIATG